MIRRFEVAVTCDASGDATVYTPYLSGYIHSIQYEKTNFTDGVDFTITGEENAVTLWTEANVNAAKVCLPRAATHSTAGVAALYAAGGTAVNDRFALSRDRVKIVVASGGNGTTGNFVVTIDDGK